MLGIFSVEAQWKDDDELPAKPMLDAVAKYPCVEVEGHIAKSVDEFQAHLLDWEKKEFGVVLCSSLVPWLPGQRFGRIFHHRSRRHPVRLPQ